ncbi:hypothetical protein RCZ01_10840 [Capnocytophaga felis]|uniref:Uncharacterized protein n=2 Tax=Capnocytophaga felis TaxID=2267611 RepID=A0A5M4B930_9FLAO|nr:hypothetical protein RCZ01_10840 [Capnocytophaga felis]GET48051.1 hypothetical protein RCZ02_08820 [Capnocytophaga felis]
MFISCNGNNSNLSSQEKEKIKKAKLDSIVEVKLNEINKDEVDTFPVFRGLCSDSLPKEEQKKCFEDSFVKLLTEKLQKEKLEALEAINEKILVNIKVDNSGSIVLVSLEASDKVSKTLATAEQSFEEILAMHLNNISKENPVIPATKQGLEVSSQFTIPIAINVK